MVSLLAGREMPTRGPGGRSDRRDIRTQTEEINREAGPLPLVRAFHDG